MVASTASSSFERRKHQILQDLSRSDSEYQDLSPKGSVDEGIRPLIAEINASAGFVTTSSCAGRISVFLEGSRDHNEDCAVVDHARTALAAKPAKAGGKGGGGKWLYSSHGPIESSAENTFMQMFALEIPPERSPTTPSEVLIGGCSRTVPSLPVTRYVHFKFEPMILHILTDSIEHAQEILTAALQAGFRESGAVNLMAPRKGEGPAPMVAVRSAGLSFDSVIGYLADEEGHTANNEQVVSMVSQQHLMRLVSIANQRFLENSRRMELFRTNFSRLSKAGSGYKSDTWEDPETRRRRKREEGLRRREELLLEQRQSDASNTMSTGD